MIPSYLSILGVLILLGALMLGVCLFQSHFAWRPELSRKSVHIMMGLVCLTFPWIFHEHWPVWLLAGIAVICLGSVRLVPSLKSKLGSVLCGVERESWGEIFFPVSVAFVFCLADGDKILFFVPVLTLTLADAVAALIEQRYGSSRYETDDGWKTVEGSTAFFIIAFLSTHVPLLLFSNTGRKECLLIGIVMGLILMLMEAIAWQGLDNLFLPLVSYVFLARFTNLSAHELGIRLGVLIVMILGFIFWRKTTRLTQSAVIGAALVLYGAWAIGDFHWLIAPLVTAVTYTLLCRKPMNIPQRHTIHAIVCVGGLGLIWLCISQVIVRGTSIYAYGVGYGANLGMITLAHMVYRQRLSSRYLAVLFAVLFAYVPMAVSYLIVWRDNSNAMSLTLGAFFILLLAVLIFAAWQPSLDECPTDTARWIRQGIISAFSSILAFVLISFLN